MLEKLTFDMWHVDGLKHRKLSLQCFLVKFQLILCKSAWVVISKQGEQVPRRIADVFIANFFQI